MRPTLREWPAIIQGGMGVAVSNWSLARAVSLAGQLGVVSGTGIDTILSRRLQDGDIGGHMRRALAASPWPALAEQIVAKYFRPNGRTPDQPYQRIPLWTLESNWWQSVMAMLGGFVEVWLAKSSHTGQVGVNLLTKVSLPNLSVLYGAMQANVDVVLMGAGIPREIPGALDRLAVHEPAALRCEVAGLATEAPWIHFDPQTYKTASQAPLQRPAFFPIISSNSLAQLMIKKATGSVQGFIIEGPTAGGHNAPPRGAKQYDSVGQPIYNARDAVDLDAMIELGYPFWLAGGYGSLGAVEAAQAKGAAGIQVGTLFAYCDESGMRAELKQQVIATVCEGPVTVRTDPLASPTGYPFKVVEIAGTLSEPDIYHHRKRICDLGYLREAYYDAARGIQFRCASEPVEVYLAKGGHEEDTVGRKCLCNALMSAAGVPQTQSNSAIEPSIVTSGDAIGQIRELLPEGLTSYKAVDVIAFLTKDCSGAQNPTP